MKYFLFLIFLSYGFIGIAQQVIWENTITSGPNSIDHLSRDDGNSVLALSNGECVVFGTTTGSGGNDKSEDSYLNPILANIHREDFWVIKLNTNGDIIWENTLGGIYSDKATKVISTNDGNILLAGSSSSPISADKSEGKKNPDIPSIYDFWVVKISQNGSIIWDKTIGGTGTDLLTDIVEMPNGDYIISGLSYSGKGGDKTESNLGEEDFWVVRISSTGDVIWDKTLGGESRDRAQSILALPDGNIIIAGWSNSPLSPTKSENSISGSFDFWIVKLDSNGDIVWDNTIGGDGADGATDVILSSNNEIVVVGTSDSNNSGDKNSTNYGGEDVWVVGLSELGIVLWERNFGSSGKESWPKVKASNNRFFISCISGSSADFDKCNALGGTDIWVFAIDDSYNLIWEEEFGGSLDESHPHSIGNIDFFGGHIFITTSSSSNMSIDKSENGLLRDIWTLKISTDDIDCCGIQPSIDMPALRDFYDSTGGDNWINTQANNLVWFEDCDPCGLNDGTPWFGITCNNNRVESIYHVSNNLTGSLPSSINDFSEMTWFTVNNNNLSGPFPDICNWSGLRILGLGNNPAGNNAFTGHLPTCLNTFSNLVEVYVQGNMFEGELPNFNPSIQPGLDDFRAAGNNFTGSIPSSYGSFSWIDLELNDNMLSECFDPSLMTLCMNNDIDNTNSTISDGNSFSMDWEDFCLGGGCCDVDLTLSGDVVSGTYTSSNSIIITGNIPAGVVVTFDAPNVIFDPSCSIDNMAVVTVENVGCIP